jgi:hypothetical protein
LRKGSAAIPALGTSTTIADEMEKWLYTEGCDGFTVMFPYLPGGLEDFVAHVVPELQRRGLFRRDYEGTRCANISACRAHTVGSFPIEFRVG